jgi:hypothetical protein
VSSSDIDDVSFDLSIPLFTLEELQKALKQMARGKTSDRMFMHAGVAI